MIRNWDDAYNNSNYIENAAAFPQKLTDAATAFREQLGAKNRAKLDIPYGRTEREKYDLFLPEGTPKGLMVFVHGGYWRSFDKSSWSHLANGAIKQGWAACLPSYTLAPDARIATITKQIGAAIDHAAGEINGPIHISGHSAGGHLAARMICDGSPLSSPTLDRIGHVMPISGLHDLRPLRHTEMNQVLNIDAAEAQSESAALLVPARPGNKPAQVTCWVGADERPEFIRQSDLLANIWTGLGANIQSIHAPDKHHFTVIDDLTDPESDMTCCLLAGIIENGD
ncbi:alpha/beta hydrolase [Thalassospira sp. TSL5-1]|uniref:alpha/beta hydrolase n=1 Tax=Thalassospira sp. TSL5-1 TaxID=1544451 RepID=UPI00093D0678|nr:alpha/beta hydrolase [Thalassospira sp. TSL5-1]OKH86401.1 esterase [Thalassospira sp. TSL5-1]